MAFSFLIACTGCLVNSPLFVVMGLYVGTVFVSFWLFHPYVRRIATCWGWPRFRIVDFLSLSMLLIWPIGLGRLALNHHPEERVVTCTLALLACVVYLWLRGLWLLQQWSVDRFVRRTLFLGVALPIMVVLGTLVGYWALLTLLAITIPDLASIVLSTLFCGVVAFPLYLGLRTALQYVFGEIAIRPEA